MCSFRLRMIIVTSLFIAAFATAPLFAATPATAKTPAAASCGEGR